MIWLDVGGASTGIVRLDVAGQVRIHKLLTSARDQPVSVLQRIADLGVCC